MKVNVYDLEGKVVEQIELPSFFEEEVREEIIRRAVLSEESKLLQPKGSYRWAGMETSAHYRGRKDSFGSLKNRGQAMLPREFFGKGIWGRVRRIPSAVGGRRAHPPKPWKKIVELINKKEWLKALKSALSSSALLDLVKKKHKVETSPIVVVDEFEDLKKTKEVLAFLNKFLAEDLERAKQGKKRKTGVRRKRKSKVVIYPKSALIITTKELKAAKNIPGIDAVLVRELEVRHLAPGTNPGRALIITKKALKELENRIEELSKKRKSKLEKIKEVKA